jgi:hypothetical protein
LSKRPVKPVIVLVAWSVVNLPVLAVVLPIGPGAARKAVVATRVEASPAVGVVAVAAPSVGVTSVGLVAKTADPVPVSSESTPASCADVVAANCASVPLVSA